MPKYIRRPFAMGNTDSPVVTQPILRGSVMKDSSGEFASLLIPSELAIETEDGATSGGISVVFKGTTMVQVLDDINSALTGYATAEEYEGCLVLKSVGTGEGAYIRIMPPVSGFDDASAVFGFEVHPHPLATVSARDLLDTPVRPRQQENPIGTKFIGTGEDRIGKSYNRALDMLARNGDLLYTWLQRSVARKATIVVDSTRHAAQLDTNVDGTIDQVDLSDLSVFNADLAGLRLYVGKSLGLTRNSNLAQISTVYQVADGEMKEIPAGDRTVRIGAVTRGQRGGVLPSFADDITAPTSPVPNTTGVSADGGNALGVDRAKHSGVTITEVRQRTTIVCAGATFETNGVVAGDVATITGAGVSSPFNHNGTYRVDVVVSEEELVLRPADETTDAQELNPAAGAFGTVVISSGGNWESGIWLSFYPPMPRIPEGGKFILTVPVESALGEVALEDMVNGSVRTVAGVDGWSLLNLWKQVSLDGAYQGMGAARGGGFFASITNRPFRLDLRHTATLSDGSIDRTSTGAATLDAHTLRLTAASTDRFDTEDVGKTILLTAGPFLTKEPWTVTRLIDNATVELAPPIHRVGYQETAGTTISVTSWILLDGDAIDVLGAQHVVSPEYFGDTDQAPAAGGYVYSREQRDLGTTDPPTAGLFSLLHLERVRLRRSGVNITIVTAGPTTASNTLPLPFDPEDTYNIYGETYETKMASGQSSITFVRILHGPDAGLYRVKGLKSVSVSTNAVVLQHIDGSPVTLTNGTTPSIAFYNATLAASVPLYGGPGAASTWMGGLSLFVDGYEQDVAFVAPVRINWRGTGTGLYAWLNDEEFKAFDNGDGADGALLTGVLFAPAEGIDIKMTGADTGANERRSGYVLRARAHTSRFDFNLQDPGAAGALFHSQKGFAGYFGQTGKDPAVVVLKVDAGAAGDESARFSGLSPSAALLVGRAGPISTENVSGPAGKGSAVELSGSLYIHRGSYVGGASVPTWSEGGVYVEDVLGAGRWAYPTVGIYDFDGSPYYGTGSYSGWEAPTRLGNPGVIYPPSSNDADVAAEVLATDYTLFNFKHVGIVHITDVTALTPSLTAPFNRFIGCRFKLDDPAADLDQVEFAIIGSMMPAENELYLALHHPTQTIVVDAGHSRYFKILGQRWYQSHIDVADWVQVGTEDASASRTQLPLLTCDPDVLNSRVSVVPDNVQFPSLGLQTYCAWAAAADGVSIGAASADTSTMTSVHVTANAYAAAQHWDGDFDDPIFTHGWSTDAKEPRSPFPNSSTISNVDANHNSSEVLDGSYAGSFAADDYTATFPGGTAQVAWSSSWGGSLEISGNRHAQVRIWQRGRTFVMTNHLAVRVQLRAAVTRPPIFIPGTRMFTIALTKNDGTVVAHAAVGIPTDNRPHDVSATLEVDGVTNAAADALGLSKEVLSLHVTALVALEADNEVISILEFKTEPVTRPLVTSGPQIVTGSVLAHGFRFTDPVPGFDTKGPADVRLLGGLDYARNESWPTYNEGVDGWEHASCTGTQELRCGPGLVRMRSDEQYLNWKIALTLLANALGATDIDAWMTILAYQALNGYESGTEPAGTFGPLEDEANAVYEKCVLAVNEGNLVDKVELAEEAMYLGKVLVDALRVVASRVVDGSGDMAEDLYDYARRVEDAMYFELPATGEYAALLHDEPESNWIRPWVDYYRLFSQGVHSAAITLYNGAFDPLWYAKQADVLYNDTGTTTERLHSDAFVPCGTTGFLVPVNPPHGAVLTSLSIGLSFRAHKSGRWGIYFDMVDSLAAMGTSGAPSTDYVEVARDEDWLAKQGVRVELWRYNAVDFDVSEADWASWSEHEPEFGFGERLARFTINLSEVATPSDTANTVREAWRQPSFLGDYGRDVYVGKEHFARRSWNLIDTAFGSGDARARVDRRHYAYMVVVRFFGGMRQTHASVDLPYVRGDAPGTGFDSRWEIPQMITRRSGTSDGEPVEGQIYGHFDAAYNVDGLENMNTPWEEKSFPPQVKFRGLRLGWITDRAGDGGW